MLPTTQKVIDITTPGAPQVLQSVTAAIPQPGPGQVLIEVHAAGVNRPDVFQRMGYYPPPPGASKIPGLEVSGKIAAIGPGVTDWAVGDATCALLSGGGYAEYAIAESALCLPIPNGLSIIDAAALPETCFTVWHNLYELARLDAGEWLLVHGGSSGIGTTAIQIASALGSQVITTAGSDDKCQVCVQLGATEAVNYRNGDFVEKCKELTDYGVDVVLDMVGGDYIQRNIEACAANGRIVNIAFLKGSKTEVDLMPVMLKKLTITGSTLRPQPLTDKARIARAVIEHVWPLITAGKFAPVIHSRFPLSEAANAHQLMESSQHIGKLLLINRES